MSHLSEEAPAQLAAIAFEVRETFGERGYRVGVALEQDPAFADQGNRSGLIRSLVKDAVRVGASREGVQFENAKGGALELRLEGGGGLQVMRVKRAERLQNGEFRILTNAASHWGTINEDLLIPEEPWVFAYVSADDAIEEMFVARVLGVKEGTPGHLILSHGIPLNGKDVQPRRFRGGPDLGLPGFDDEEDQGELGETGW